MFYLGTYQLEIKRSLLKHYKSEMWKYYMFLKILLKY